MEVKLLKSNLAPLYEPVNHLDGNDNDQFYGDTAIFEHFCPYPIPEKYKLRVTVHKVVSKHICTEYFSIWSLRLFGHCVYLVTVHLITVAIC